MMEAYLANQLSQVKHLVQPELEKSGQHCSLAPEQVEDSAFAALLRQSSSASSEDKEQRDHEVLPVPQVQQLPVLEVHPNEPQLSGQSSRRLAGIIRDSIHDGVKGVELRLMPEELGKLILRITLQGDTVHLQAETEDPQVVNLLLSSQQQLADNLERWGLMLGSFVARSTRNPGEEEKRAANIVAQVQNQTAAADLRRSFIEVVA